MMRVTGLATRTNGIADLAAQTSRLSPDPPAWVVKAYETTVASAQ